MPQPLRVLCVAGARPNFPKIAPILRVFDAEPDVEATLVHTGQHWDDAMSRVFFDDLNIPRPEIDLGVGGGSHAVVTARLLERFEPVLQQRQPHVVLVVGDVNSTAACALVASKFHLDESFTAAGRERTRPVVVHVEAGLRSGDRDMPEEINRIVTDALSDICLVSDPAGLEHLAREGVDPAGVAYVGNVMIDTLLASRELADRSDVLAEHNLTAGGYVLVTLHRPSNVDDAGQLREVLAAIEQAAAGRNLPIVFPVHPRTRQRIEAVGITLGERWKLLPPAGYLDFVRLIADAGMVMSDSGGIQEEATVLGVRCVTLRDRTERPITLSEGTNVMAGSPETGVTGRTIAAAAEQAWQIEPAGRRPRYWDGHAGRRVVASIAAHFANQPMQAAADAVQMP
jgi:UDP-N-acetylglucosamine 2-epimerase (non-hydrolysing)